MRAENNKVELTGTIITEPEFNHEVFGEGFYNMHLKVDRLSGTADKIGRASCRERVSSPV